MNRNSKMNIATQLNTMKILKQMLIYARKKLY